MKSVNKSIRLDPGLYGYINAYRGNGFSEKFENIVRDARDSEAARKARLEELDRQVRAREALVQDVNARLAEVQGLIRSVAGRW